MGSNQADVRYTGAKQKIEKTKKQINTQKANGKNTKQLEEKLAVQEATLNAQIEKDTENLARATKKYNEIFDKAVEQTGYRQNGQVSSDVEEFMSSTINAREVQKKQLEENHKRQLELSGQIASLEIENKDNEKIDDLKKELNDINDYNSKLTDTMVKKAEEDAQARKEMLEKLELNNNSTEGKKESLETNDFPSDMLEVIRENKEDALEELNDKLTDVNKSISETNFDIGNKAEEVSKTEEKLNQNSKSQQDIKAQIAKLEQDNKGGSPLKIGANLLQINLLREKLNKLEKQATELKSNLENQNNELNDAKNLLKEKQQESKKLQNQLDNFGPTSKMVETIREYKEKEQEKYNDKLTDLNNSISETNIDIGKKAEKVSKTEEKLNQNSKNQQDIKNQIAMLEQDNKGGNPLKIGANLTQINTLREKLKKLETEATELKSNLENQNNELNDAKNLLKEKQQESKEIQNQLDNLDPTSKMVETIKAYKEKEKEKYNDKLTDVNKSIAETNIDIGKKAEKVSKTEEKLNQNSKNQQDIKNQIAMLEQDNKGGSPLKIGANLTQINTLREKLKKLETEATELKSNLEIQNNELNDAKNLLKEKQQESKNIQDQLDSLEKNNIIKEDKNNNSTNNSNNLAEEKIELEGTLEGFNDLDKIKQGKDKINDSINNDNDYDLTGILSNTNNNYNNFDVSTYKNRRDGSRDGYYETPNASQEPSDYSFQKLSRNRDSNLDIIKYEQLQEKLYNAKENLEKAIMEMENEYMAVKQNYQSSSSIITKVLNDIDNMKQESEKKLLVLNKIIDEVEEKISKYYYNQN